jgi:tetratricopeptide (TPR) repeat protein
MRNDSKNYMKGSGLAFLFSQFLFFTVFAQSITIEQTKVMNFFQNQQYDDAIIYLTPAINNDTNNIEILGYLGYAQYMNDNPGAAEKYFEKIYSLDSNNIRALQYLTIIYSRQRIREALHLSRQLIKLRPDKSSYYRQTGDLLRKSEHDDSALVYYRQSYILSPEDFRNIAGLADVLVDKKNFPEADSILNIGLAKDSMNVRLLELRIKSAYDSKNYQSALYPGERLMKTEGLYINGLTELALSYYFLRKYEDCIRVCNFLEDENVISESIFYYEARAWSKLRKYEKSNELLRKCVQLAISNTAESYYFDLGENYDALGQPKKAIMQYDTAFYLFKNPVMTYNCGRIAEEDLKNERLARKYYAMYLATAKPQSADEKKAYEYVKSKLRSRETKKGYSKKTTGG